MGTPPFRIGETGPREGGRFEWRNRTGRYDATDRVLSLAIIPDPVVFSKLGLVADPRSTSPGRRNAGCRRSDSPRPQNHASHFKERYYL